VRLFNGARQPAQIFAPAFLAQIPAAQVNAIAQQLGAQFGRATGVDRLVTHSPVTGTVYVAFERGMVRLDMALEPVAPHRITGLQVVGTELVGDTLDKVMEELRALPGEVGFASQALGTPAASVATGVNSGGPLAIGSAFKLFILAELSRQIAVGERKWPDAVPLTHRSLPSGLLQDWPQGSPVTLYSLAALMISRSDNSAADTLLHLLGREKVEAMMSLAGVAAPERNRPFLSTMEAFALKGGSDDSLRQTWIAGDEAARREVLGRLTLVKVDPAKFGGAPNSIDTIEWFASADDLIRLMDWLRLNGGRETLDILAINPGIGEAAADRHAYLGFKGGSEPGVINLTFLVRTKAGAWHAVSGSWNNKAAPLDEARFVALMTRAVALLR
jgi:beta-lactamase class A